MVYVKIKRKETINLYLYMPVCLFIFPSVGNSEHMKNLIHNWIKIKKYDKANFLVFLKKKNFLFYIEVQPINNARTVSGEQQRYSAIYIHVSILSQTPLPPKLPHNFQHRVPHATQ